MNFPSTVVIEEQGLRDGLQSESVFVPTEKKVDWVHQLVAAGLKRIQVTSFVSPKLVPQMRDAEEVFKAIRQVEGVVYSQEAENILQKPLANTSKMYALLKK